MSGDEREMSLRDARAKFAEVVHDAAIRGEITYLTNRGRRVAMIAPLPPETPLSRSEPSE